VDGLKGAAHVGKIIFPVCQSGQLHKQGTARHYLQWAQLYFSMRRTEKKGGIVMDEMKNFTKREREVLADNFRAYIANFEMPVIERSDHGGGYYVFRNAEEHKQGSTWIQFCYNIDYLNGWLYGAVQAACGIMKRIDKE
jgi:hypothetical protein